MEKLLEILSDPKVVSAITGSIVYILVRVIPTQKWEDIKKIANPWIRLLNVIHFVLDMLFNHSNRK